jgi:hypothetical protein
MRAIILLLFVSACEAPEFCQPTPGVTYAADQLEAFSQGCPLGVSPSGHPLTDNTPCVDLPSGLPTDYCEVVPQ